jgi:hypothetical protein
MAGIVYGFTAVYWWHQNLTVPPPRPVVGVFMSYNGTVFSNQIPLGSDQSTSALWQWYPTSNSFNATFYIVNMGTVSFNFSIEQPTTLNSGWSFHFTVYGSNCTLNTQGAYRQVAEAVYYNTTATAGQQTGDFNSNIGIQY